MPSPCDEPCCEHSGMVERSKAIQDRISNLQASFEDKFDSIENILQEGIVQRIKIDDKLSSLNSDVKDLKQVINCFHGSGKWILVVAGSVLAVFIAAFSKFMIDMYSSHTSVMYIEKNLKAMEHSQVIKGSK